MAKDRQEIIAVLDLARVGQRIVPHWQGYRETIADSLMALPEVGDEQLRELLSHCRNLGEDYPAACPACEDARMAYADVAEKLAGILDGER